MRVLCAQEVQNYLQILVLISKLAPLLFQILDDFSGTALALFYLL